MRGEGPQVEPLVRPARRRPGQRGPGPSGPGQPDAEIGRPTVEVVPADPEERVRLADLLRRFGELVQISPDSVAVRCEHGEYDLAEIVRTLDAEGVHVANLQLHAPSLDDVFLEKTGRTLEGAAAEAEAEAEPATA